MLVGAFNQEKPNLYLGNYLLAADLARGLSWDSVMVAARPQMKE